MKRPVIQLWKDLRSEGSFVQNSAWMFASSGISILIQFGFFYVLARIYSPAVYGLFGIFNVYTTTLGNAASLGLNQAFVLPKDDRSFSVLLKLACYISIAICGVFAVIALFLGENILHAFGHEQLGQWIHWVAPVALLMALDRIVSDWAIRNREFKKQTYASTSTTLLSKLYNVWHGLVLAPTVDGLIFTTILQYLSRVLSYLMFVITDTKARLLEVVRWHEMKECAREYRDYPRYVNWGNLLNIFSNNLPAAMLPLVGFGLSEVGYYVNSVVLLDIPIRLLGAGIASVYLQKAAELHRNRPHELARQTWRVFKYMLVASCLFLFIVASFGEILYTWVFSVKWSEAGLAAEVLAVFYFFRMLSSPLSSIFNVMRSERSAFLFQIILVVVRIASLYWGSSFTSNFVELMGIYALANAFMYLIYLVWIFRLIKFSVIRMLGVTILFTGVTLLLVWVVRGLLH